MHKYNKGRGGGSHSHSQFSNQFPKQYNYFPNQPSSSRSERPTYQICGKLGHLALDCYHRMDYEYQRKHPPTKLSAMATSFNASITQDQPWLADSVTTDHVTSSLNHLSFPRPFNDQELLTVGNA